MSHASFGDLLRGFRKRRKLRQQELAEQLGIHRNTIGTWERGDYLPEYRGMVLELARLLELDEAETRQLLEASLTALSPYWLVPLPRNPFFTGREAILEALHTSLDTDQKVALTQSYALHGLGGIGKTQIALEYAYRYALEYRAVFWIGAETAESIVFSLLRIAEVLQLPGRDDMDQQRVVTAVQHWLTTHNGWLLIWDNVEDLGVLDHFLPPVRQGAILLTTRRQTLGTRARGIDLLPMEHEEGILFLLRRAKILEPDATSEQMRQMAVRMPAQYAAAAELVIATGGLPLALDQAGAYMEETQCGLPAYLDLFRTRRAILLQQRGEGSPDHPATVSTTFTLAIRATTQRHPAVGDLLRVCALLQPDAIPEELFLQGAKHLGVAMEAVCHDVLDWNQLVAVACSYSLLSRQAEEQTLSMHRLVQMVLLDTMTKAEREQWIWRVIHALNAVFPEMLSTMEYAHWKMQCDRLLPHALICFHQTEAAKDSLVLASLAYKAARYLRERGRYVEAEPLYLHALRTQEKVLGLDHPDVARTLNNLAVLFWKEGRYLETEPFLQRALHIREQVLGLEHPDVATTLNYLALLYWKKGTYVEAELLFRRALHIWEQALGPEHSNVAYPLNNLAILYAEQGKYAEAEPLFRRALHIWEQTLGPEHPDVAQALHNLAELARDRGNVTEAELLYQRALHLRKQVLGSDHPEVVQTLNSLAELFLDQGKYEEAESLYQQALQISEQRQGTNHSDATQALNGLANLSRDQGNYAKAELLYQRTLSICEQHLGQHHPETAQTLHDLAAFRQQQSNPSEALSLAERALAIRSQSLGDEHPKTVATRALYAQLIQEQGHTEKEEASK